ncbi:MAG: hypothetical protein ACFNVT_07800 [Corynebacterium matruchotii]
MSWLSVCSASEINELDNLLIRNKSAWTVGTRAGRRGLTRRVIVGG